MLLNRVFEPFLEKRPVCVMARAVLERMFDPARLDALFEQTAVEGYTRQLHFSTATNLLVEVVLGRSPSVHAAYQAWESDDKVSATALYNKLNRIEPCVSAAFVQDAARQAAPVIDALRAQLSPWLNGYRCRVLDGNHLSATEHRLEELRTLWDAPLPGRALVVLDQDRMLVEHVFLTEDGHMQERKLLDQVLECAVDHDLWIADRNLCTQPFLVGLARKGACFAIRQHGQLKGKLLGKRRKVGRIETGVVYEQQIQITDPATNEPLILRRVTVQLDRSTRDGDTELHVLTNLPKRVANACAAARLYRKRWTIEVMFQEITTNLECEIKTMGYPPAALFAFCLALVIYNAVSVLKAALRATLTEAEAETISPYYLALELRGTYEGMMIAIPDKHWRIFRRMEVREFVATLKKIAGHINPTRYRKHPRGPKKPPPKKRPYANGGHVSTYRLLQERESSC